MVALTGGEEAVRLLLDGTPFDVVLCDLIMPAPNGIEVFHQVTHRRPELKDRFIFMTGGAVTQSGERFLASSRGPLVEKPFDAAKVEQLIGRIAAR